MSLSALKLSRLTKTQLRDQAKSHNALTWALVNGRIDGKRFSLQGHEYLRALYRDDHPDITIEKASQMGATIWALNTHVFYPCDNTALTVIYFFPTETDVRDFSNARVKSMIEGSPYLQNLVSSQSVDNVGLKQIGNSTAYFRGMKSSIATKSVPADILIFDELDEAEPAKESQALKRLSHSSNPRVARLSTPSIPDFGIDRHFDLTDQRYWGIKCQRCNEHTIAEFGFPENIIYEYNAKDKIVTGAILVCHRCRKPVDTQQGEWIPKYPHRKEKRGYHLSGLYSSIPGTLNKIMQEYLSRKYVQIFYNHWLGLPYVDSKGRVTISEVKACIRDYQMDEINMGGSYMGTDVGDVCHSVIATWDSTIQKMKVVWLGTHEMDYAEKLINRFEVKRHVIDAMPYKDSAQKIAAKFPGRVWLCYYDKEKGAQRWDEVAHETHQDRTASLDGLLEDIRQQNINLPNCEESDVFAEHCHALVKKQEEDEETGDVKFSYIRTGEDHYGHAANYMRIALLSLNAGGGGAIAMSAKSRMV